ncbi:MAG: hypothetical protein AB1473_14435 [Thermodesulfobacteriota bacterium]
MIFLPNLDRGLIAGGLEFARYYVHDGDSFAAFFFAYYPFNHYYDRFAAHKKPSPKRYQRDDFGRVREREKLRFLADQDYFQTIYVQFQREFEPVTQDEVRLPVINMMTGESVPHEVSGDAKLSTLSAWDLFDTLYTIRNNLFHGQKRIDDHDRDWPLCAAAAQVLIAFLDHLLRNTTESL